MNSIGKILYLSRADVEACGVTVGEIIIATEGAFRKKGEGKVVNPLKPTIFTGSDSMVDAMPFYDNSSEPVVGVVWYSAYLSNRSKGLPFVSGLDILNDPETGVPISIMDCTWLGGLGTAAGSAVAAKELARPGAKTLGMCGIGVQARAHMDTLAHVLKDLAEVKVYGTVPKAFETYVADMSARYPNLNIHAVSSPKEAFTESDVVVTLSSLALENQNPVTEEDWLAPGSLWLAVAPDRYFSPSVFEALDKFLVDDIKQIKHYQEQGVYPDLPPVHGELGQVLAGQVPGRERDDERIIIYFDGIGMCDLGTAPLLFKRAKEKGQGVWLDL